MGAPTWPPTPEEAAKQTADEYGEAAAAVEGAESEEEAEYRLLARYLYGPAPRMRGEDELGTRLEDLGRPLGAWLSMLAGRQVPLAAAEPAATDGTTVFLPPALPAPARPAEDALVYRLAGLVQVGLLRFGLLDDRALLRELYGDWILRATWHLLAARWVLRRWISEWPGLAADVAALPGLDRAIQLFVHRTAVPVRGMPEAFRPLYEGLVGRIEASGGPGDAARRAVSAVEALASHGQASEAAARPAILGAASSLRNELRRLRLGPPPLPFFAGCVRPEWVLGERDVPAQTAAWEEWKLGPRPLRGLLGRARGRGRAALPTAPEPRPAAESGREYDEWDGSNGVWRAGATRVDEVDAPSGPVGAWRDLVAADQDLVREVRRRFEALRVEPRWLHAQPDGSDLDLDRAVAAVADRQAGHTSREDWYMRWQRERRPVAILVLVDLSGSVAGRVLHHEQRALVLVAEGLRSLGAPHALYGFSGDGPRACRFQRIKGWDEPATDAVHKRLGNLRASGATRLGAFLRHATRELARRPEPKKLLLVVSDGRPEDRDGYRGAYGVADAAAAARQAARFGVHVRCVSLDPAGDAEDYLRRIFGPARYLLLPSAEQLPARLPEVLRGLVT